MNDEDLLIVNYDIDIDRISILMDETFSELGSEHHGSTDLISRFPLLCFYSSLQRTKLFTFTLVTLFHTHQK